MNKNNLILSQQINDSNVFVSYIQIYLNLTKTNPTKIVSRLTIFKKILNKATWDTVTLDLRSSLFLGIRKDELADFLLEVKNQQDTKRIIIAIVKDEDQKKILQSCGVSETFLEEISNWKCLTFKKLCQDLTK